MQLNISQGVLSKIWDSTNKTIVTTGTTKPAITNGNLYIGYDATDKRAMLFADLGGTRYPFAASVKWGDITGMPDLATQSELDSALTSIENTYLKKSGGTMTGEITLGQGDGKGIQLGANGRINATDGTSTTCTIAGVNGESALIGHTSFNLTLRGKAARPSYTPSGKSAISLALYSDIPTDFTTTTAATNAEKNAKEHANTLVNNLKSVYFQTLTDTKSSSVNSFTLTKGDGSTKSSWTANNYYPTGVTWTSGSGGVVAGTIAMCNNGTANTSLNVAIPEPPQASELVNGIVNTSDQSFKGKKNFATSISLTQKINLSYNTASESLDFTFIS